MTFKKSKLLSLLLAFLLVVSVFPASAFAAEIDTDHCGSTEPVYEIGSDTEIVTSGTVGESEVWWALDTETGWLTISGSGGCENFTSAEDQPWAHLRGEIREVWFNNMDALSIENLAYWFDGCTALHTAEIPYTTLLIGERAFANCPSLEELKLYYYDEDEFEIVPSAFISDTQVNMRVSLITEQQLATHKVVSYAWDTCNREVQFFDVYSILPLPQCGLGTCTCNGNCDWYYGYTPRDAYEHNRWVYCTGCDASFGVGIRDHVFGTNGYCTDCGYYGSSSGGTGGGGYVEPDPPAVCYHYSTSLTWVTACEWYKYCNSCCAYVDSGVTHGTYSYGSWQYYNTSQHRRSYSCSDCGEGSYSYGYHSTTTEYSKYSASQHTKGSYCSTCSSYIGSTTKESHSFTYGSWTNYDGTQHRRTKTCSSCGYSTYEYANHSLTYGSYASYSDTQHRRTVSCSCGYSTYEYVNHSITNSAWASISATQHQRTNACSVCNFSKTEQASHSLTNGEWTSYNDAQHRRTKSCSCGYSTYEYGDHAITTTAWKNASATQHSRTHSCSACAYSKTEMQNHSITSTAWKSADDTKHSRTNSCSCGYSALETASHAITHSAWTSISEEQHQRTNTCSCGYSVKETIAHADGNADDYCDSCNYLMTRFSVTVPANLVLTVAKNGKVYAPSNAAIVNNSTGAVAVKSITVTTANGWTLVPYSYNMAQAKVDSKQIGFTVNGAATTKSGSSEVLNLSGGWQIAKGELLALNYHAVVSATSKAIDQQVLTIVFVVDWAK